MGARSCHSAKSVFQDSSCFPVSADDGVIGCREGFFVGEGARKSRKWEVDTLVSGKVAFSYLSVAQFLITMTMVKMN